MGEMVGTRHSPEAVKRKNHPAVPKAVAWRRALREPYLQRTDILREICQIADFGCILSDTSGVQPLKDLVY